MTESMIERVARAIDPYAWSDRSMGMRRAVSKKKARAAIEAMREPTEAMIMSQGKSRPDLAPNERIRQIAERLNNSARATARLIWQEMIDGALQEKP